VATRPNGQILYALSMGNEHSSHLGGLRARALAGAGDVAWLEWSMADDDAIDDRAVWIRCNSGYPDRISMTYMEKEYAALGPERFARERLGKSEWPSGEPGEWQTISEDAWMACYSEDAGLGPAPALAGAAVAAAPAPGADWESWPDGIPPWIRRG